MIVTAIIRGGWEGKGVGTFFEVRVGSEVPFGVRHSVEIAVVWSRGRM